MSAFATRLIAWQAIEGRNGLPWQGVRDPYAIWLSEIMLQQTQVAAVIPYFLRFLARFPDIGSLAAAPVEEVLGLWSGLGYYARARNLHKAARAMKEAHGGTFPRDRLEIEALPGIGRSTAAAIAAFAWGERAAILDGNVKRVLARWFGVTGFPGEKAVEKRLWELAESLLPETGIEAYTQGMMDLGATVCTRSRPACARCPMAVECVALREGRVAELPAARPTKFRPLRRETVLVLLEGDGVRLERRPPAGVWGGLFALPVLPDGEDPVAWIAASLGLEVSAFVPLPVLGHDFSHFRLEMSPLVGRVTARLPVLHQDNLAFVPLSGRAFEEAPLPAPVRRILLGLAAPGPT